MLADKFLRRITRRLTEAAYRRAIPQVRDVSRTLAKAMTRRVERPERGRGLDGILMIPHYWAVYAHDGRQSFETEGFMVWWQNPRLDPRLRGFGGQTPPRRALLRRLTRAEFRRALEVRERHIALTGTAYGSPVVITQRIGRATRAAKFFDNQGGMQGTMEDAHRVAQPQVSKYVEDRLKQDAGVKFLDQVEDITLTFGGL